MQQCYGLHALDMELRTVRTLFEAMVCIYALIAMLLTGLSSALGLTAHQDTSQTFTHFAKPGTSFCDCSRVGVAGVSAAHALGIYMHANKVACRSVLRHETLLTDKHQTIDVVVLSVTAGNGQAPDAHNASHEHCSHSH